MNNANNRFKEDKEQTTSEWYKENSNTITACKSVVEKFEPTECEDFIRAINAVLARGLVIDGELSELYTKVVSFLITSRYEARNLNEMERVKIFSDLQDKLDVAHRSCLDKAKSISRQMRVWELGCRQDATDRQYFGR